MLDAKIQTFLEVAAQGSYTRAAERLHLTQPAVTQQIHRLEEHYGHRLVDTCGRVVRLTEAGMLLEHHARMQLANERRFMERMAAEEPPLSLGATLSIADYYLPGPLARALAGGLAPRVTVGIRRFLPGACWLANWTARWWRACLTALCLKRMCGAPRDLSQQRAQIIRWRENPAR